MVAVIIGGEDSLVANRLEEWLREHGVEAVRADREQLTVDSKPLEAKYVFIFDSSGLDQMAWSEGSRVVFVNENSELRTKNQELNSGFDWRAIKLHDVYGPGMGDEGWLPTTLRLAVKNQNLILPPPSQKIRLLYVEDAVEAIMRACLMSGTAGNTFEVYGEEITSADLAVLLMDLAKMTKTHVAQIEPSFAKASDDVNVVETWEKLRWRPEMGFREGMEPTLQYFFGKIDEEARRPKPVTPKVVIEREKKGWDVEVEESNQLPVTSYELEKETEEIKIEKEPEPTSSSYDGRGATAGKEEIVEEPLKIDNRILEIRNKMLEDKLEIRAKKQELREEEIIEESEADRILDPGSLILDKEEKKPEVRDKNTEIRTKKFKLPRIRFGLILSGILGIVAVGMVAWWGWPIMKVANLVSATEKALAEGKTEKVALEWAKLADLSRSRLEVSGGGNYGELMRLIEEGSTSMMGLVETSRTAENVANSILNDKDINWETEGKSLINGVDKLWTNSGKLSARMAGDWRWLPFGAGGKINDWRKRLVTEREGLEEAKKLVGLLPEILGVSGRREYMVLLQNQMELRPSGGFIGSYGILTFENGKLTNFTVNDVYEADGQLKGHVEPPEPIKKYLGEAGYFMRDANWKADFTEVSKDIQWFLEKETGRKVDGVIGINLEVVRAILGVVGEMNVPDFGEKINKDNLYEQAEYYSETKFFPGSKQKASFLGGISRQLFEEIKTASGEKRWKMMEAMLLMLNNREIQMAINNKEVARALAETGWSGGMFAGECAKDRCLADYLFPVEANLGVNKANYFIRRQTEMLVEIGTNAVVRTVKISYENTAKSNAWPGGDYKNYLRVYLPIGINMAGVKISDGSTGEIIKTMGGEDMTIMTVAGKTEVGMLVMVPINSKRVVEFKYVSPINLLTGDKFSYLCYLQKQSGWGDTGLVTLVSMPPGWQPVQVEPEATVVGGKLLFNRRWERDIKLGVEISK